jgi:3-isopropylmalate/(R)-2-methylmalate dehydratase small subunit
MIRGRIWILGDDVDTDLIVPSRVLTEPDQTKLFAATLEVLIPEFSKHVQPGDIIVAGRNFGCGSSREEAVYVLKKLGIAAIIAESFARIFFRNMINLGLPPLSVPGLGINITKKISSIGKQGDFITIDLSQGIIKSESTGLIANFVPFPPFLKKYLDYGGALAYIKSLQHP